MTAPSARKLYLPRWKKKRYLFAVVCVVVGVCTGLLILKHNSTTSSRAQHQAGLAGYADEGYVETNTLPTQSPATQQVPLKHQFHTAEQYNDFHAVRRRAAASGAGLASSMQCKSNLVHTGASKHHDGSPHVMCCSLLLAGEIPWLPVPTIQYSCLVHNACLDADNTLHYFIGDNPLQYLPPLYLFGSADTRHFGYFVQGKEVHVKYHQEALTVPEKDLFQEPVVLEKIWMNGNFGHSLLQNLYPALFLAREFPSVFK